jgi:demethylmenaquinone methyltransferase/2-methoxy-6-polyprenyl-1,4-benzoquinol methylase
VIDKSPGAIRKLFAEIAPQYDRVNSILTMRLDSRWRRFAARHLTAEPGWILDLAAGTGDLALALQREGHSVVAADFTFEMLIHGRGKLRDLVVADALALPFRNGVFDGVTVGWGIRSFADPDAGIAEIRRVLKTGGALGVLDVGTPSPILRPFFRLYFAYLMPLIGRAMTGSRHAYRYLRDSVQQFPEGEGFLKMMKGFDHCSIRRLSGGITSFYRGERQ